MIVIKFYVCMFGLVPVIAYAQDAPIILKPSTQLDGLPYGRLMEGAGELTQGGSTPKLPAQGVPVQKPSKQSATDAVVKGVRNEWLGYELPLKTVLLTFDDGPHVKFTPQVIDILKQYRVGGALFFQLGLSHGRWVNGQWQSNHTSEIVQDILKQGWAIGNHTVSHFNLTRLEPDRIDREIANNQLILKELGVQSTVFRPPYGARNHEIVDIAAKNKLQTMMWNIDSKDWADPSPKSIAARVLEQLQTQGRGIVLMHDIHARTVEALPIILEKLKEWNYQFAGWDGQSVTVNGVPILNTPDRSMIKSAVPTHSDAAHVTSGSAISRTISSATSATRATLWLNDAVIQMPVQKVTQATSVRVVPQTEFQVGHWQEPIQSDSIGARHYAGWQLFRQRQYRAAVAEYQAALKMDQQHIVTLHNIAYVYYRMGWLDDAATVIQRTLPMVKDQDAKRTKLLKTLDLIQQAASRKASAVSNVAVSS